MAFGMTFIPTRPIFTRNRLNTMKVLVAADEDILMNQDDDFWWGHFPNIMRPERKQEALEEIPSCWLLKQIRSAASIYDRKTQESLWGFVVEQTSSDDPYEVQLLRIAFQETISMAQKRSSFMGRLLGAWSMKKETARLWFSELGSLNFLDYEPVTDEPYTICSRSLKSPSGFTKLRHFLNSTNVSVEDFIRKEVKFLNEVSKSDEEQGPWTEETLAAVFDWDFRHLALEDMTATSRSKCVRCNRDLNWDLTRSYNALWELGVKQIRAGKSPDGPFEGEERQLAEKWERYYERCRAEIVCQTCQDEEERRSETYGTHFEPSPLLLDI